MLAPLSWLKEYIDITLPVEKLAERLSEVGVGVESIKKENNEVIFELEITPNRPDLLCMVGVAREIAAIENKKIKLTIKNIPAAKKKLELKVKNDFKLLPHYSSVIIDNVKVQDSPNWMKKRLLQLGLRPINNIVDITNYVMFELGIPLHSFDYDEIHGKEFFIEKAKGGEKFTTVDDLSYSLPKDAIIIKDANAIVDLIGIKGGLNSGITKDTRTVLLQTSVDDPVLVRRASLALSLRSDASNILEKGIDKNGLLPALGRAANLILELAGGEIASDVIDLKKQDFKQWRIKLNHATLLNLLGIEIPPKEVESLLNRLNLKTTIQQSNNSTISYSVTIPTYRNDLKIEEDLIEEVARLYGYNSFPKTLLSSSIPVKKVPYYSDKTFNQKAKEILVSSGFSEIYTYSLVSETEIIQFGFKPEDMLRVDNPVSREYEYLRPTLKIGLEKALAQNKPYFSEINLFELGKVYLGKNLDQAQEVWFLSGITNSKNFYEVKGILEKLLTELGVKIDPSTFVETNDHIFFQINFSEITKKATHIKIYKPIPKYPPIIEDLALVVKRETKTGDLMSVIRNDPLVAKVSLLDLYEDTQTFHIVYQSPTRNLTKQEVTEVRSKLLKKLQQKFGARLKE